MVNTMEWGYKSSMTKKTFIHTGFWEEAHIFPQVGVETVEDEGRQVGNGEEAHIMVRVVVWVPRAYSSQNPGTLKNWAYQMMMEVKRIILCHNGTILTDSSNDDYALKDNVVIRNMNLLKPDWYAHEGIATMLYVN